MSDIETELEAQLEALSTLDELKKERDSLLEFRISNLPSNVLKFRNDHSGNKNNLKSDVKKTSAFVKKIKAITAEGIQQCIRDTEVYNLTLYVSEIVAAILETKYKATDSPSLVKLCVQLHRRYEDFTPPLITGLKEMLLTPCTEDDKEIGKRKRIQIRLILELYEAGLVTDDDFFCQLLRSLLGKGMKNATGGSLTSTNQLDLTGLVTFIKYGSELLLGIVPRNVRNIALQASKSINDVAIRVYSTSSTRAEMQQMITEIYKQISDDLIKAHADLRAKERRFEKEKILHGSLSDAKQAELEGAKKLFEKLHSSLTALSASLDEPMPQLVEIEEDSDMVRGISVWEGTATAGPGDFGPYGDADTRAFYEDLPDLLSMVPLSALGLSLEQAAEMREQWKTPKDTALPTTDTDGTDETDVVEMKEDVPEGEDTPGDADDIEDKSESTDENSKEQKTPYLRVTQLLEEKLPECSTRAKADEFCVSFCYCNNKGSRKRLIAALGNIPRHRFELIPIYSRVTASLARVLPDISQPILDNLWRQFYGMFKTKNQQYIDSKLRNIRHIGELTKFGVAPPITALKAFKLLLNDFVHHNVELLATLLETCGRYLYLLPVTKDRIEDVLETMMRLRRSRNLDIQQQSVLVTAYFTVKPPERTVKVVKPLTPLQAYIRHIIIEKLGAYNADVDALIRTVRRLPWNESTVGSDVERHLIHNCLKLCSVKYISIPFVADLLSGLSKFRSSLLVCVVDSALEELQRGMDAPHKRDSQTMLGLTRLLAELYNFSALSSTLIFDSLYHFINYSHEVLSPQPPTPSSSSSSSSSAAAATTQQQPQLLSLKTMKTFDPRIVSDVDPPDDLIRAQLVCEMLGACGAYFVTGTNRGKLEVFLVYFQRYLLSKSGLPPHVEFTVLDMYESLEALAKEAAARTRRKHMKSTTSTSEEELKMEVTTFFPQFESFQQAQDAVDALLAKTNPMATGDEDGEDEEDEDEEDENRRERSDGDTGAEDGAEEEQDGGEDDDGDVTEKEAARLMERLRQREEEDDEFEKAFKSVLQESVETVRATAGSNKGGDFVRMAIPVLLPKPKAMTPPIGRSGSNTPMHGKTFKLLSRDTKGRVETRELLVPLENPLALRLKEAEESARDERRLLKEQVLSLASRVSDIDLDDGCTNEKDRDLIESLGNRDREWTEAEMTEGRTGSSGGGGHRGGGGSSGSSGRGSGGSGRGSGGSGRGGSSSRPSNVNVVRSLDSTGSSTEPRKSATELNLTDFLVVSDEMERRRAFAGRGGPGPGRGQGSQMRGRGPPSDRSHY